MNIFYLDSCPKAAATYHVDKHVVKMILETAQMLSTAHHVLDGPAAPAGLYKRAYENHPCSIWVRENSANYSWTYYLLYWLCIEYTIRYGRAHKTGTIRPLLLNLPRTISRLGEPTPPPQAMPDQFKHPDPVTAYRNYYREGKAHLHSWTYRPRPFWI